MKRKLARAMLVLAALITAVAGPVTFVSAQDELQDSGCAWTTRWKDIHGNCTSACCDSTQYSCPCTV
jgi:hypothetical protein